MDIVHIGFYIFISILFLFLGRGLWIIKRSGDARLERKRAEVRAREGRGDPDRDLTYHQRTEAKAIMYIKKIPVIGRIFDPF